MSGIRACPLCSTSLPQPAPMEMGEYEKIECDNCGTYLLSDDFHSDNIASNQLKPAQLATLSHAVRRMQGNGPPPFLVQELSSDILRSTSLPTAAEQLDNLVLYLGRTLLEPGQKRTPSKPA